MDWDREMIEEKVFEIVAKSLKVERGDIVLGSSFEKDLKADSLDLTEMVMDIEDKFTLLIPTATAEKLKTIGDIVNYLVKQKIGDMS